MLGSLREVTRALVELSVVVLQVLRQGFAHLLHASTPIISSSHCRQWHRHGVRLV